MSDFYIDPNGHPVLDPLDMIAIPILARLVSSGKPVSISPDLGYKEAQLAYAIAQTVLHVRKNFGAGPSEDEFVEAGEATEAEQYFFDGKN